ncbi:protein argonaute-4 isoform X2 [Formica exsecta]|uniref:protein argonaute-4 isoform X2 n=1 Tax=Formica exsecta TaxID=72781 RepID=UPI0011432F7A|nr:protein argonaute-4 isoform X2 [Formica exsecta]
MGRKGKKKKQGTEEEAASTSKATSSEQLQKEQASQQKEQEKQVTQGLPQKQQVSPGPPQQPQSQSQLQGAWAQPRSQQQVRGTPQQQQEQRARDQPQQQVPRGPPSLQQQPGGPPQPQGAWGQPQQPAVRAPQPQGAWGQPQQAAARAPQPQGAWGQPRSQQQGAWGQPQQPVAQAQQPQGAWSQPQSQQQVPRGPPPSQQQPGVQGPPQQQEAWGQPQSQQQVPRGPPPSQQQPGVQGPPQQQGAWGQPQSQQQVPRGPPPSQQQPGVQGPPQQQGAWGQPQSQQQLPRGPPPSQQQPGVQGPPQQQGAWGQPRSQQQVSTDIGGGGDSKLVTGKDDMQQPTTSIQSELSQMSLRDPLTQTKTSLKAKMTSSAMKQYQLAIPRRKNPWKAGTLGTRITVYTNMFEIIFNTNFITNAVHYDVDITPIAPKALYRKVFEQCRVNYFKNRYPAFDGKKNAYSANDLPFNDSMESDIEIYDNERERQRTFKIAIKKVANIDLSWVKNLHPGVDEADRDQTSIQVLDIIMRHAPESRFLSVGRSLFWNTDDSEPLGGGLSLSRGGFSSAVLGWKPYINIDVVHKGFPTSQNVISLMAELTRARGQAPSPAEVNDRRNREKIEKFLKGLKVIYQIPGQSRTKRTYRLNGLGPSAVQHQFECDGSMITIIQYFAQSKNYNLRYPDLPCLWAGATNRAEKIYLPAELCTIAPGQSINRKLDEEQTTSMIRYASTPAPIRKRRIEDAFAKIDVNNSLTMRQEFHMSVHPRMKEVDARILPAPLLQYNGRVARVNKGIWQIPGTFLEASNLGKDTWTILDLSNAILGSLIHEFVTALKQCANEVGMVIGEPQTPFKTLKSYNHAEITEYFRSRRGLNLIIVIIPDRTDTTYGKVKQITELKMGILTQCIKFKTIKKNSYSAVKNILLKINSKLNGVNHIINSQSIPYCLKNNDCMLVGADVTHPSPDAINIPSIAAVAASSNTSAFQYNIALRLQQPKEEMILDIEEIIISQLQIYKEKTSRLPNKIIYYRDGVSEGQLAQVMHFEISAIKRACTRWKAGNIQITCLVVQKRHHVRLFPTHDAESDDRNKNVKAGTIVDTEITHPNHIDFYLVSHASIQGTARPTKYRCICNESSYTEDNIEELTYYLCHMYARCTRAVSYPAPTYYAHLGAYRGRALIEGVPICLDNLDAEQNKLFMIIMKKTPMCFV